MKITTTTGMLSIVIPAHNEAARIGSTLESYLHYFSLHRPDNFEIIVVLNGCKDNTFEIVNRYRENDGRVKILKTDGKGKGNALKLGFRLAKGNIVSFTDAPMAFSSSPPQ
jgi:glycosyltransferase involved in cell wall biosynthesis